LGSTAENPGYAGLPPSATITQAMTDLSKLGGIAATTAQCCLGNLETARETVFSIKPITAAIAHFRSAPPHLESLGIWWEFAHFSYSSKPVSHYILWHLPSNKKVVNSHSPPDTLPTLCALSYAKSVQPSCDLVSRVDSQVTARIIRGLGGLPDIVNKPLLSRPFLAPLPPR